MGERITRPCEENIGKTVYPGKQRNPATHLDGRNSSEALHKPGVVLIEAKTTYLLFE